MHKLPLRVSIANAWGLLGRNDSQSLERWKTQAFFGMLVEPGRHDWYVMLDDDTLPNLASLTRILCLLHGDAQGSEAAVAAAGKTAQLRAAMTAAAAREDYAEAAALKQELAALGPAGVVSGGSAARRALGFGHNPTGGLYMGWTPKDDTGVLFGHPARVFATGQGFLMDQQVLVRYWGLVSNQTLG